MKQYDVRCPKCGAVNKGLYLQETGGKMECSGCGEVSRSLIRHRSSGPAGMKAAGQRFYFGAVVRSRQGA